jgi:hypothetical protein
VTAFPWPCLERAPDPDQRRAVLVALRALLVWQQSLAAWPSFPGNLPEALPIVSIYVGGKTRGCMGSLDGSPGQRLARSFLEALHDRRFPTLDGKERARACVVASYLLDPRRVALPDVENELEPGTHGLACVPAHEPPALLHPSVAVEHELDASGMLRTLARKANRGDSASWRADDTFYLFCTHEFVVRPDAETLLDARGAAVRCLEGWIDSDGSMAFALDARSGQSEPVGTMHHGRAAVGLCGLARQSPDSRKLSPARAWLAREIESALSGRAVRGWPDAPDLVAGTLALSHLAGAWRLSPEHDALLGVRDPWHAAQVVTALGSRAPRALVDLALAPRAEWSPWSLKAALLSGTTEGLDMRVEDLLRHVRTTAVFTGGVGAPVAEIARTAATVEALLDVPPTPAVERAAAAARAFLLRWQWRRDRLPWLADGADGGFPVAPNRSRSQVDTLGHALSALPTEPWAAAT